MKKLKTIISCLLLSMTLFACSSGSKTVKIGVIQYVQHESLDKANEGFFKALDDLGLEYTKDNKNASADQSNALTIANNFVSEKVDLIFAIATPTAQAAAGVTSEIPIVITAVTDAKDAGLVESNEKPNTNVTGTSDLTPVALQIKLLKEIVPSAKKVAILYSTGESNSLFQANIAKSAIKDNGMEALEFTCSTSNEIQQVMESMKGKVDAIYVPTDNMMAASMALVSSTAIDLGLPLIAGEDNSVKGGALATIGINYYNLGYKAGEMAYDILKNGKDPKDMAIQYLPESEYQLIINKDTMKKLNLDLKLDGAEFVQ